MVNLRLQIGENESHHLCDCCGKRSSTAHGFVYENDVPKAIYYAGWSEAHPQQGVTMAVGVGAWHEESTAADRMCFALTATEAANQVVFSFIDPESSPWHNVKLLGRMLSRHEALDNAQASNALTIAETIVRHHPAIQQYLHVEGEAK